jgi:hypothetical protein
LSFGVMFGGGRGVLALASRCLVFMCKADTCHLSAMVLAVLYFRVSGGRSALPVPLPAATSLLTLL